MIDYQAHSASDFARMGIPSGYREVALSDTEDNLPPCVLGLLNGTDQPGEVNVITAKGTEIALPVAARGIIPGAFRRVKMTGTTVGTVFAAVW